jgi:hypothetical protein
VRLDATIYRRTFTNFADDDVFLNTGISFPIAFRSADIRGVDVKLTLPRCRAGAPMSGFAGYSNLLGRADLPVTGGLFLGSEAANALAQTDRVPIRRTSGTRRARACAISSRRESGAQPSSGTAAVSRWSWTTMWMWGISWRTLDRPSSIGSISKAAACGRTWRSIGAPASSCGGARSGGSSFARRSRT